MLDFDWTFLYKVTYVYFMYGYDANFTRTENSNFVAVYANMVTNQN